MLTKEPKTTGRVTHTHTHTHTHVISRNKLDRGFCALKSINKNNRKLVTRKGNV